MKNNIRHGAYPTMITPYDKSENVDYGAVRALVDFYDENGCDGIFAACQSSEIIYLSLADRVKLAATVKDEAARVAALRGKAAMSVVASGHISEDRDEQINELRRMAETGVDAVVLISNRSDIADTSDEKWIDDTSRLLDAVPENVMLGTYECPKPYKRLLTPGIIDWMISSGRFAFIKDTCCDAAVIADRLKRMSGTGIGLFNANAQTLLETLRAGAFGYCGVMCNFHPKLYSWLTHNINDSRADRVQAVLCMAAFTESLDYPCTAKYHLRKYAGINMELTARSADYRNLTDYHKSCIDQMKLLTDSIEAELGL